MPREAYSELMKTIVAGRFVFTGEIEPKKTAHFDDVIRVAKALKGYTVACNVTDNPRAQAYLSSLSVAHIVQKETGMETICQMTVRDRNRLALFSELLGAAALGIRNVLTMSGDHTSLSDNPGAMPVYDIDTAQFVYMVRRMVDEGVDLEGNKIDGKVKLHVGIVGNPNADPLEVELLKIERKVKIGADFMQTQVVFDVEKAKGFLKEMTTRVNLGQTAPRGSALNVPSSRTGIAGTLCSRARMATPFLKGMRLPSKDLPPSGKMQRALPPRRTQEERSRARPRDFRIARGFYQGGMKDSTRCAANAATPYFLTSIATEKSASTFSHGNPGSISRNNQDPP